MTSTLPPNFPRGPLMCPLHRLPVFETEQSLRAYLDTLPAVSVDHVLPCTHCNGFHAVTHMRPASGSSSGSSSAVETLRIPEQVRKHNEQMSARK